MSDVTEADVQALFERLDKEARAAGYNLNTDSAFVRELVRGLLTNQNRFGYQACPCRLAAGTKEDDLDIICPCDYRDPDLEDYGACYCALYVSEKVLKGEQALGSIPERRPGPNQRLARSAGHGADSPAISKLPLPVWRCRVCGYLCAREGPPEVCPICKVKKDRFERFI
ncbi:MAG: Ferredoxin thioredoxin reductase catalytic beta chain [Methanosaeta sp. PtaB.Bin039]|nr:MAG: Ferredoxin thioredoxin reductase catalytic beta chain [Methanosaeta sp. PtaB.Bin039]OPY46275.1 MAG: Ferredoxin thioredoxin reductase catalytic beta chain [Methanosaeta sp. PtaU1.Bin028]HOT06491.1 ferredoxin-thioredoxin reductase catalytic domain-containing protein [Methanotrichaceae archaeon]HQF15636.1 ferredoxin-thioredoxin reductase catalytic domain-containing protein [Methanotrichaceae archaeon]HQI90372.1 ferredoxin-thioredoxin reductase catalytic domain-containing protein [Methanotr